jgi:hypothetical protein
MKLQLNRASACLAMVAALLLGACASQQEPATQAIAGIENAINAATDAGKYIPDQLAGVQSKLTELKTAFDNKDYKTVLARAPAVLAEAQGLLGATMLKKESVVKAMSAEWPGLAAAVPGLVTQVSARVATLAKNTHTAADIDLAAAKSGSADATLAWSKAQAAFAAGDVEAAVTSAREAKAKAEAAAAAMKMKLAAPAAARSP